MSRGQADKCNIHQQTESILKNFQTTHGLTMCYSITNRIPIHIFFFS